MGAEARSLALTCAIECDSRYDIAAVAQYAGAKVQLRLAALRETEYLAMCLQCIAENTAIPVRGRYVAKPFGDLLHPKPPTAEISPEEQAAEIVSHVLKQVSRGKEKEG